MTSAIGLLGFRSMLDCYEEADNTMQIPRVRKLIAEAIRHDPKSAKLREIQKKLGKPPKPKGPANGIEVMSWGKKRR